MKSFKKTFSHYGISIIFILSLLGFLVVSIILGDQKTSDRENRPLQQMPQASASSIKSGRFQNEMETYLSDQFPSRSTWVKIRTNFEHMLGKNEFHGVYIGKDNELFQESIQPDKTMMKAKIDALNTFASTYQDMNISMLLIPNKATILSEKLPANIASQDQMKAIGTLQKGLNEKIKFVNTYDALKKHKKDYIYYRSDHHWTSKGAYIAFEEWKKAVHPEDKLLTYDCYKINDSFYGTLANTSAYYRGKEDYIDMYTSKQDPKYYVQYASKKASTTSLYDDTKLDTSNPYEVFLSGNEPLIDLFTTVNNTKHLLILKDSYANCFIPYILSYYSKITIVDPRYYYEDLATLIKDRGITDTLFLYNANTFFSDTALQSAIVSAQS